VSSLGLTWNAARDNTAVTGYKLFLSGAQVATTSSLSYTFTGLTCAHPYTLGVAAVDGAGNTSAVGSVSGSTAACGGPPPLVGDLNGDGRVNCADLDILNANFGKDTTVGDLNGNGTVDANDLSTLLTILFNSGVNCSPARVNAYDNYGSANAGRAMCRGNPSQPLSMPGGTVSQTFTVPSGVAAVDDVLVQIDPDASVTGHASLAVNGRVRATVAATAAGDTTFSFARTSVAPGDQITFSITFSATSGKIITVYTAGSPGGTFTTTNTCPDGAPSVSTTSTGLRAVVHGWDR
jgi:hypothetical protein